MPDIDIQHPHTMEPQQARAAVQEIADKLTGRFGVVCHWDSDTLHFDRSGIEGQIEVAPSSLNVTATLGFLFAAMKAPIEAELRRVLDKRFS